VTIHNNTSFTYEEITKFKRLAITINEWRQRNITLYQHPNDPERVISVGVTFNNSMIVVADEAKTLYQTALDYAKRGKIYTNE
jgi:hypothetical protein